MSVWNASHAMTPAAQKDTPILTVFSRYTNSSESRVLRMGTAGLTNPQIAARLDHQSPHPHLRSFYNKLGVT